MKLFDLAHSILLQILDTDISFSPAMRNAFKNEKNKTINRHDVSSLVGCALRHHLVFKQRSESFFQELDNNQYAYVALAAANKLFVKVEDEHKVNKELAKASNLANLDEFISSLEMEKLIPEEIDHNSFEYLSLRFNTPLWLVKMWNKHYGENLTYRLLKSNIKPSPMFYQASESFEFGPEFEASKIEGVYKYIGKTPLKDNRLFPCIPAMKYACDKVDIDPYRGIAIYSEVSSYILSELLLHTNKSVKADFLAGSQTALFETKRLVKEFGMNRVSIFECQASSAITAISQLVHTFFVLPNSSNFALLRNRPEFFLRIKQEELDGFINHEMECLDECSKLVEEGGQLVYMVQTLSNKEGHGIIDRFIRNHPNYQLIDEKQFFPCNSLESSFYFAILSLKENRND